MSSLPTASRSRLNSFRRWIRLGFLSWAVFSTAWLANSMRTRGVDAALLQTSATVAVADTATSLAFTPTAPASQSPALLFFCGSGVTAEAYAPLLRPLADAGQPVFIVKLPWRFAPLESHKAEALTRARAVMAAHPEVSRWVVSGHSLGAALACRLAAAQPADFAALVLVGTTHPKADDLSRLTLPVTKVYATHDGIAPVERVMSNRRLLPAATRWVEIAGGNHSQFGHYGHQLFDGEAAISREEQQQQTLAALRDALAGRPPGSAVIKKARGVTSWHSSS